MKKKQLKVAKRKQDGRRGIKKGLKTRKKTHKNELVNKKHEHKTQKRTDCQINYTTQYH